MAFVFVMAQELATGKGVIEGIQEGNPLNIACVAATVGSIAGVTILLALKGSDNYVDKGLGR
jgi:hypothetical protein